MSTLPEHQSDWPVTVDALRADFAKLGVKPGMALIVHSSLRSLGWVNGGPAAVILALEHVLTPDGTLVMPTHTSDLSDPANWVNPPVPEVWWETIRDTMPAYEPDLTPTFNMGVIPETFRKQAGVLRSSHPQESFAAWGKHAALITADHALEDAFGEHSPLARLYDLGGWVLLLGVGHANNTSLHLAEARADIPHRIEHTGAPMLINGARQWVEYDQINWDSDDFEALGADFAREPGYERVGKVGSAPARLMPQRALVEYGIAWLEQHRAKS
jgi:aminoglycoside 3-N-acetyltransferase